MQDDKIKLQIISEYEKEKLHNPYSVGQYVFHKGEYPAINRPLMVIAITQERVFLNNMQFADIQDVYPIRLFKIREVCMKP